MELERESREMRFINNVPVDLCNDHGHDKTVMSPLRPLERRRKCHRPPVVMGSVEVDECRESLCR